MRNKAFHIFSILLLFVGGITTARAQEPHPTPQEEKDGILGYKPQSRIKIAGNVYGGGDQAAVEGNTHVIINTGEYGGEIFGGGNGAMEDDGVTVKRSADVGKHDAETGKLVANTGDTHVTINGGEIVYYIGAAENGNHNIYGGGNLACNVAGSTHVSVNKGMITAWSFVSSDKATAAWQSWYDNHKADQKSPVAAVFGAGYGANTDVAKDTHVDINIGTAHSGEYNKTDLVTINGYIVRDRPNPLLSQSFVTAVLGGGYNGTVGAYSVADKGINRDKDEYIANTNVTITGSPYMFNVFGGGLGSKDAANKETNPWGSHVGAVYGGTKVDIHGGFIYGDVFGGGAGINGQIHISTPYEGDMPYINAAQVYRETDVTINGDGTVIIGNVYGGGDIANTGWYTAAARPTGENHQAQENMSLAKLDYTTSVKLKGGNIMGTVFAGANGRKKAEITMAEMIGAVIGSTNITFGNEDETGATVWNNIYAGGNAGSIYSCADIATANGVPSTDVRIMQDGVVDGCTNAAFYGGKMAKDIFGGGFGDDSGLITSADISGNTYVYFKQGKLEFEEYWDPETGTFKTQTSAGDARNTESDICHNLYGGGNVACIVKGSTHVHMEGAPSAPPSFALADYYSECIANVAKPHFSSFGGGFGKHAEVRGDTHSDINLKYGTGMHSIIGGGMNGPVGGYTKVHVGSDPSLNIHHVYGGGYYASCKGTQLDITRGNILENVFGGSVMGNINEDGDIADIVTETTIGLQTPGDGRHSSADLEDESGTVLRSYTYEQHKNEITIGGNVYGANDVSGTVNGIAKLTIYGGTFKSEVYGAGNGNHIGYYVPDQLRYDLGEHDNNYYYVDHTSDGGPKGNTYVSRPQTLGGVELTLEGNTEDERVSVLGQVFGGGNSCTIGEWDKSMIAETGKYHGDPHLTRDDPAYFQGGGKIDILLGSHVTIGRKRSVLNIASDGSKYIDNDENVSGLFMGCSGKDLATQSGAKTDNHYHHFFSRYANQYLPGFIVYKENGEPEEREEQLKPFQAYLNNILVWTDNINLSFKNNAEDIWLANFVGGGFRGSMRLKESTGRFDYRLPIGVTVNHAIIGGAYNSHVKYKLFATNDDGSFVDNDGDDAWDYATIVPEGWQMGVDKDYLGVLKEDPLDPDKVTAILRYNYNGGMLAENSTGVNSSDVSEHIHTVHADPRKDEAAYATAYFEPKKEGQEGREDETTRNLLFTANKEKTLLYLQLNCALEPEVFEPDAKHDKKYANGGNVYGGCFSSGFVEGDSWVDYSCWLSPKCTDQTFFGKQNNLEIYAEVADLDRNNAMSVFGAGFGTDTHSMGDVYLRIKNIDNAVLGDADPNGKFPYIYNAFGGSNMGEVDGNVNVYYDTGAQGTLLGSLYGGSYQGGIGGNTFVELASGFLFNVYGGSRKADINGASHVWAYDGFYRGAPDAQHLIVCNLYGGNDIAGTISGTMPIAFTKTKWNGYAKRDEVTLAAEEKFNTYVEVSTDSKSERGFPLIGSAYAGGNGLNWNEDAGVKPEVKKALIEIGGGSTLNAFGGGNMATVTEKTCIFANAEGDTYANVEFTDYQKYIVQKVFFNDMKRGYKWDGNKLIMDEFHVMNLFGGNNLATMDIQPTWNLAKGRLENVYSGGNMGDMTYYNPDGKPSTKDGQHGSASGVEGTNTGGINADGSNSNYSPRGLTITVEQPDIFIQSLFGGCRMSDVRPTPKAGQEAWPTVNADDYYGATVNITDGYINNIYGGNDISGTVVHGTNVNISGAVSGNVYGSGNGFYLYKFDPTVTQVTEENDESEGGVGIYYRVPERDSNNNLLDNRGTPGTDTHKILTINEVRPSVEKAFLNIGGLESYTDPKTHVTGKRVAYVKGNVFCGGNASTVTGDGDNGFTKFKIGSYVTLNGVFMGSDGLAYTANDHIAAFAKLNEIDDMGADTEFVDPTSDDAKHNGNLLNTYMMAVDMLSQPRDFNLNLPLKEAHIGTYCGGGNRGSMLVDKTVELPFHHDIIIYDKIVGACLNANVEYNQGNKIVTSYGGYTRAIDLANNGTNGNTKMRLNIASQFVPLMMDVPDDKLGKNLHGDTFEEAKQHDFLYSNHGSAVKYTYEEYNNLFVTNYSSQADFEANEDEHNQWKVASDTYAPSCNIYGGCYESGEVEGDIELNLYTNMLRYVNKEDLDKSLVDNIACFNVYGAGFGQNSHVWGNVKINMDRSLDMSTMGDPVGNSNLSAEIKDLLGGEGKWDIQHSTTAANNLLGITKAYQYPSFNNVFGGGRNGKLIGNATVEIRNGLVYSDVAGGCYSSDMYGSTHVIVGYPQYWVCNTSGEYKVQRGDTWNEGKKDVYGNDLIKQSVKYLKGDLVPNNIYEQIVAANSEKASNFKEVKIDPTTRHTTDGITWNDIYIKIGRGLYGGGYSLENSTAASAGSITTHKLQPDFDANNKDLHAHNFNTRIFEYDITDTNGYGGNSNIMVGDQADGLRDHIDISTLKVKELPMPYTASSTSGKFIKNAQGQYTHLGDGTPDSNTQYYELSGEGGVYGDGHLTFCEGFRTADITRYGYAQGTPQHPKLLNTFQRMDLLSVNDCCLMLQGAQDFATDQIDATVYSITRVNELRMNSSLNPDQKLGEISAQLTTGGAGQDFDKNHQRNYLGFFNNVHYLGSIVTNDDFNSTQHAFHNAMGEKESETYVAKKQSFIDTYKNSAKDAAATSEFKQRNVGTARNAIGINNGYCLRIQNQEYVGSGDAKQSQTYYGPIVGVCEVKLLTLVQGEGGGYVYADNIHNDPNNFLMTSGNFVFPGIVSSNTDIGDQYIVDDCFLKHFGTPDAITTKNGDLDEAHYWYVEGNKYFFTTTLTGFTYQEALDFNLIDNDPNVILSGIEKGSDLNIKKIEWLSTHRQDYDCVLENNETSPEKIDDYEFDIQIGGIGTDAWANDMPRHSTGDNFTTGKTIQNDNLPQFNIFLQDKLDNSGDEKYINHLDEPEVVKIYLEGKTKDANDNWQTYEYTITLNIVYLQGPTFEGGVTIENCALPGERIGFSSSGIKIKTPELMPITSSSWQILPLTQIDENGVWHWDNTKGIVIPESYYNEKTDGNVSGSIPALYKQNEYTIAFIFTAGGKNFPVMPKQDMPKKEQRMIVVHNYHRMKDVVPQNLQIETMVTAPNMSVGQVNEVYHPDLAQAKLYIEDEDDLIAFVNYLNMATATYTDAEGTHDGNEYNIPVGLTGLDIILQKDITLSKDLPEISVPFAGTFHGDGHHIDLGEYETSLFGDKLAMVKDANENIISQGKVYNLGLVGGTISNKDTKDVNTCLVNGTYTFNSYEYSTDNDLFIYGKNAYDLSHHFTPTTDGYVEGRYTNGDYQYATADRVWSLRTGAPNYGQVVTHHDRSHAHDENRWNDDDTTADVDILSEKGTNVPLYNGTKTIDDKITTDAYGDVIDKKYGLPESYANDYLFFGQHLDKTSADAYPMHIEDIATGDTDRLKGGNRVYKTAGYYHSKVNDGYYYNKDAWALQPTLTAIDYTKMTEEGDGAATLPASFSVDSNKDVSSYSNATEGHVSQNLLVYNAGESVFDAGTYADKTAESAITYHSIVNNRINYFHLVDKQCFNAPIAFNVANRAWYERMPERWRNVTGMGESYTTPSAWEGICLPFTARKVSAVENGELSHFYGTGDQTETIDGNTYNINTLHHEYWLTGFTKMEGDATAVFSRPSVEGSGLFVNEKQKAEAEKIDYTYPANTYFTSLVNYTDYHDKNFDESDEEGDEWIRSDAEWYLSSHKYEDYVPLTASVPYLIAFPGNDFYEFSLEGRTADDKKLGDGHKKSGDPQLVTFENKVLDSESPIQINVSDTEIAGNKSYVNDYYHVGTYMRAVSDDEKAYIYGVNSTGSAFTPESDTTPVLPFRTYMTRSENAPQTRAILISDGYITEIGEEAHPEDELGEDYLKIWGEGRDIVVETSKIRSFNLFGLNGAFLGKLECKPGVNRFTQEVEGIYLVGKTKVLLK